MTARVGRAGLRVDEELAVFVETEALAETGVTAERFWSGLAGLVDDLGPDLDRLLRRRRELQGHIDSYHQQSPGTPNADDYRKFLRSIGYLMDHPPEVAVTTAEVDPEVGQIAGPQLVVPVTNARFAINAANARWGSLYDALYGTDVIAETDGRARGREYNPVRGAAVTAHCRELLDRHFPLTGASHTDAATYRVDEDGLSVVVFGKTVRLVDPGQLVGYTGERIAPRSLLLRRHGLHLEIQFDRDHPVGATDPAGIKDVILESAVTCIMDLEDSVATVDAPDKVLGYRNWLGLARGTLRQAVNKNGQTFVRSLATDREFVAAHSDEALILAGRALTFIRHVGHHMTTSAVLDRQGREIPEGFLDALVTSLSSLHAGSSYSRPPAVYAVKPKLHGPEEVTLTMRLFDRVEDVLGLPRHTIKIGVMDEERRTSLNLAACIAAAAPRLAFINSGFLDRTGDEISTSMHAGPVVRKAQMRSEPWFLAYEASNVATGLAAGLGGRGQIGKGMWTKPDHLRAMMREKVAHPLAGASCAWVPSPTAATIHALHYLDVDVTERQRKVRPPSADHVSRQLILPLLQSTTLTRVDVRDELESNVQSVLGYVVRWIDAGVGCSKVPDLDGVPLMEDRATCRISSQHVTNWLLHGILTPADVEESMRTMALVVDAQNASNPGYQPLAPTFTGPAWDAARALLLHGIDLPHGYTESVLGLHRRVAKKPVTKIRPPREPRPPSPHVLSDLNVRRSL